ncbi:tumor necrosis factor receptor superfamily member 6 [Toxotes jaculatrix]|uniref:tumor necrosis factor receptor superfamily member 6 n=1 Tax=Toxotes jaculatrix TaxID=941984 RepID=UPI001B3AD3CA|nr:tumor necrosis factor receptor superfamily member 6 [Toxotes jaculatrix]
MGRMASDSDKFSAWILVFLSLSPHVSLAPTSSQIDGNATLSQVCADGTYQHEGNTCCLCGAGQRLERHCTVKQYDEVCKPCDAGTYISQPNSQQHCEPCTSCDHPNANLEVAEACTAARNTKCRCKEDHYCSSGTETCRICHPCEKCDAEGVKVACTATNNTVCNDKTEGENSLTGITIAVIVVLVALGVGLYCLWRRFRQAAPEHGAENGELEPLKDIEAHMPEIAEVLGWKNMRDIALRGGISQTVIETCKQNHPNDGEEQTLQLLMRWVEQQGSDASKTLVQMLQDRGKMQAAEKVRNILRRGGTAGSNSLA